MCGIAGWIAPVEDPEIRQRRVDRVLTAMHHRGHDQSGQWTGPVEGLEMEVTLVHARLSIIDLAGGRQPLSDETGDRWITYNGEIYNFPGIKDWLEGRGHRFKTRTDTETIVHLWEEKGEDAPGALRGMYAFGIWDSVLRRLCLVRDRLGIKPLYYARLAGGGLVFASEMKALWASGWIEPGLNDATLPEYWALGYGVSEQTLFGRVLKVMPGESVSWSADEMVPVRNRYWSLQGTASGSSGDKELDEAAWLDRLQELLSESVRMRLLSDVPLGMFLSGGLDSSLIAALMRREIGGRLNTFSVGYAERESSELEGAREVARHLDCEHHEVELSAERFWELLPRMVWHEDEPVRFPSSLALFAVAEAARSKVKVVLTGEGSDELFAGYAKYWATLWNQRFDRAGLRWVFPDAIRGAVREGIWHSPLPLKMKKSLFHSPLAHGSTDPGRFFLDNWFGIFGPDEQTGARPRFLDGLAPEDVRARAYGPTLEWWNAAGDDSLLKRMLFTDIHGYLVELLMKQDQMSMAANLESRVPFLDHVLVEAVWRMPDSMRLRGRTGKWAVRRIAERLLPQGALARPKRGFPTPVGRWLRESGGKRVRDLLLDEASWVREQWGEKTIDDIWQAHIARKRDHTERIWLMLNFELWHRTFLRGRAGEGPITW
jgi:asparagine synthase (glutamine-hydrolysing)